MRDPHITGGVWSVEPVSVEPDVVLRAWSIRRIARDGSYILCGYNVRGQEGRVSTAVTKFDPTTLIAHTSSGRVYHLLPNTDGFNTDAEYVWDRWLRVNSVTPDGYEIVRPEDVQINDLTHPAG